jgi:hypothetical protein
MKRKGFSIFEAVIVIVILGFIGSIGGSLFVASFKNYLANKKNYQTEAQVNIKLDRLYNYLMPLFNNFDKPLTRTIDLNGNTTTLIFAVYNNLFRQPYYSTQTYLSQIIRIDFNPISKTVHFVTFQPPNASSDTLFIDSSTNFTEVTSEITEPIKIDTIISTNLTKFNITYYDIFDTATVNLSSISHIAMHTTISTDNISKTLSLLFSPWRLNQ